MNGKSGQVERRARPKANDEGHAPLSKAVSNFDGTHLPSEVYVFQRLQSRCCSPERLSLDSTATAFRRSVNMQAAGDAGNL